MKNILENYIRSVSSKFSHAETSELEYRTDFEILMRGIFESINGGEWAGDIGNTFLLR